MREKGDIDQLSEEECAVRYAQAEALASELGFTPGNRVNVVYVRHSPYGTDFVVGRSEPISGITGLPGDRDIQVSADSVRVGTTSGNYPLSTLQRWSTMDVAALQAEAATSSQRYWQKYGYKPDPRHPIQVVLREIPGYYAFRRAIQFLGLDII